MAAIFEELKAHYVTTLRNVELPELNTETYQLVFLLTLPYFYYTYLWHFPTLWCKMSESLGMHPSTTMSHTAHVMKLIQFAVLIKYGGAAFPHYFDTLNGFLPESFQLATYEFEFNLMSMVDIALVAAGQALNYGVYQSLGVVGTYYGVRFGYNIPWVTGFPYNLGISDPQYWGAILTVIGSLDLLRLKNNTFFVWVLLLSYIYMMAVEYGERTPAYASGKQISVKVRSSKASSSEKTTTPKSTQKKRKTRSKTPTTKKATTTTPKAKKNSSSSKKSDGGDLSKLTCAKLRQMLKAQGLKQKGVKADLIARLQNA